MLSRLFSALGLSTQRRSDTIPEKQRTWPGLSFEGELKLRKFYRADLRRKTTLYPDDVRLRVYLSDAEQQTGTGLYLENNFISRICDIAAIHSMTPDQAADSILADPSFLNQPHIAPGSAPLVNDGVMRAPSS